MSTARIETMNKVALGVARRLGHGPPLVPLSSRTPPSLRKLDFPPSSPGNTWAKGTSQGATQQATAGAGGHLLRRAGQDPTSSTKSTALAVHFQLNIRVRQAAGP